jgi:cytidine deaminase
MRHAYAPYSDYRSAPPPSSTTAGSWSGATSRTRRTASGLCAECGLVSALHASGGGRLTHFVCVNRDGGVIMPCGRCRQLLFEAGGPTMLLLTVSGGAARCPRCSPMRSDPMPSPIHTTMHTTSLDLTAPEVVADPYPFFAEERRRSGLAWHEPSASYLTFDHATANAALRAPAPGSDLVRP